MLHDPNVLYLGSDAANSLADIRFVDEDITPYDDPGEIDAPNFNVNWRLTAGSSELSVFDSSDTKRFSVQSGRVRLHGSDTDLVLDGELDGLRLADTSTQLTLDSFDGGIHSIRRSSNTNDLIADVQRHGEDDYDLHLYQSGSSERVHTTGDGDIDAATLNGRSPSVYGEVDQAEEVSGLWDFTTQPTVSGNAVATESHVAGGYATDPHDNAAHSETYATEGFVTDALVDVYDGGAEIDTNVAQLDFTTDLGVTSTTDGVEVSYTGAQIPSNVYEDGTLVLGDADGIDFLNDFNIADDNGTATVTLDVPADLASTSADETITGSWDHTGGLSINGAAAATESYVDSNVFSTSYGDLTGVPSEFTPATHGDEAHSNTYLYAGANESISGDWSFSGALTYGGNDVATDNQLFSGSYTDLTDVPSNFTPSTHGDGAHSENYAHTDESETITSAWTFNANLGLGGDHLTFSNSWRQRYSGNLTALVFEQDGSTTLRLNDDGTIRAPNGFDAEFTVAGDDVATEPYVGGEISTHTGVSNAHHAKYTDSEAESVASSEVSSHASNASAHHAKYTDSEAISAVEGTSTLNLGGSLDVTLGATIGGDVTINGDLTVDGSGSVSFHKPLNLHSSANLNGNVSFGADIDTSNAQMTSTLEFTSATTKAIRHSSGGNDVTLIEAYESDTLGWDIRYMGSNTGDQNYLDFNSKDSGTALRLHQQGGGATFPQPVNVTSTGDLSVNNDTVVVGDSTYKITKNGTDANGYINFKT